VTESSSGQPLEAVRVSAVGSGRGAIKRGDGRYRFAVAPGRYVVIARLIGYAPVTDTVVVAEGETATQDFQINRAAVTLGAVAVVGSRRQSERSVTEAPVPIDVVTAQDIKATGRTETSQILQTLVPSLNFPRSSIAGGVDMQRPFTLRGLGPDQALVLVNGKRRHTGAVVAVNNSVGRGSAGVDLNAIPSASIERIEVLRDGAAAQYGSDAIGGVVNVILKGAGSTPQFSSTLGQTTEGDGGLQQVDGSYTFGLGQDGYLSVTVEARNRERTNRAEPDQRPMYWTAATDDSIRRGLAVTIGGIVVPQNAVDYAASNYWYGDAALQDGGGFLNAAKKLGVLGGLELYSFGGVTNRKGRSHGFFRRPQEPVVVRALYPYGFLPNIDAYVRDVAGTAGGRGRVGGVNYDLSSQVGGNSFDFHVTNTNNPSLGLASPRDFYAGQLRSVQWTSNLDLAREFALPGVNRSVNVAGGAEVRRDSYHIAQGDSASWVDGGALVLDGPNRGARATPGAQLFYGFKPTDEVDATRTSYAAYGDVETNITRAVLVDVAGRYEHFSDFGSASTGKVSARFAPVRQFAVRGAFSTGFRAPSLAQSNYSSTASNVLFVRGVPTPNEVATLPVSSEAARALGATPLKAERSRNYSAGVTITPAAQFTATVDYFRIDITDRVVLSENFVGDSVRAFIRPFGLIGDIRPRYFTNAIDTRTNGLDVVLRYAADLGGNAFLRLTGGYNQNRTQIVDTVATPEILARFRQSLFGRVERNRTEEVQPRNNVRVGANYSRSNVSLDVQQARFGSFTIRPDLTGNALNDQTFGAKWITDVSATYRLAQVGFTLGSDNVFDIYPDRNIPLNQVGGTKPYSEYSPFGQNGRFVYFRVTYSPQQGQ
jgi:iron complex outermembrane receptor protein